MTARLLGLIGAILLFGVLFYTSRFWVFALWDGPGLFGLEALPPQGNLVDRWLRGTPWQPYALVVWAVGAFALLSVVQALAARLRPHAGDDP